MSAALARSRFYPEHLFWVGLALVLPVAVAAYVITSAAVRQVEHSANVAGYLMLGQIETIIDSATLASRQLLPLTEFPCAQVRHTLNEVPPRQPYIRAVSLLRQRELFCASEGGESWQSLAAPSGAQGGDYVGSHFFLLKGTEQVPDRLALVLLMGLEDGRGVTVTIDGQYLLDVLSQSQSVTGVMAELALPGGHRVASMADAAGAPAGSLASTRYPMVLTLQVPAAAVREARWRLWRDYGPFVLIFAGLLAYGLYRLSNRRLSLPGEIRRAMRNGEIFMMYQPVIHLDTGICTGVEALMRWRKPGTGLVRPDLVFAVAEENALAIPLTRHIFGLIAADIRAMPLPPGFHVGVNAVPEHLDQADLLQDMRGLREAADTVLARLVLEITERRPLAPTEQVQANIDQLRRLGIQIAIDDFGTGHSSLAYLEKYATDYIKIDRGFVSAISSTVFTAPVLELIINLGARLHVALIAEGIETQAQADYLRAQGVQYGQGYLFARPMPASLLRAWLGQHEQSFRVQPPVH